ncbi:MAG: transglutaminase-like domain-containing protein [Candidatus Izemoplasmatales bacterium]
MKKGYGIFGKAYETMFQNDLHDKHSIDHNLLRNMILVNKESVGLLYQKPKPISDDIRFHGLYDFSLQFKGVNDFESICNVKTFLFNIVHNFDMQFEDMVFGGTEKEIIERGTDWCTDISRVGAALLQCLNIPSRIVVIVNKDVAYNGHQVVEAYVNGKYMMCDFLYGVVGEINTIYSVYDLLNKPEQVKYIYQSHVKEDSQLDYISGLYNLAAISEYDITKYNNYNISRPNDYYLRLIKLKLNGQWQMEENN